MLDDLTPVLVGGAQLVERESEPEKASEPLEMLERIAREAAEDAGAGDRILREVDTIGLVDIVGWHPQNAPRLLAERVGGEIRNAYVSAIGGEMPLTLLNHVARRIQAGEVRVALLAGVNNLKTLMRARQQGIRLNWSRGGAGEPTPFGESRMGSSEREVAHGLARPPDVYPLFENALRVRRGLDIETHRQRVGALMSRFSEVAADNPHAWFPVARSADEITQPGPRNRMVAFPYTKYMNAILETDQAAGVWLVSAGAARALGIPEKKWVYWWGGAHAEEEAWYASERPDLARCPALRDAAGGALADAGVSLEEIDRIDFYSCFPVAVEMACEMLGLDEADPRGFTVTGGLPYAGGPGSNYTLHSLATMSDRLRGAPGSKGLVTGNGWYLTRHSACVLASAPRGGAAAAGAGPAADPNESRAPQPVDDSASGTGRAETYTVLFDREGAPTRGIVVGRTDEGRRFLANTPEDRGLLESLARNEKMGFAGSLRTRDDRTVFDPS